MKISCCIKALRKEKDLTQEDLADKLGVSRQAIISVESGKSLPSLPLALEMAELFEKTIEEIFNYHFPEKSAGKKAPSVFHRPPVWKNLGAEEEIMNRDLIPWRPFGLGRFFDEDWLDLDWPRMEMPRIFAMPAVNVYEKGKNVVVEVQLPGIDPEDVKINVSDNLLKISGEKKEEKEEKDKNFYRREISYGSFARSVSLPTKVKSSQAEAEYTDGILKVTLPKAEAKEVKMIKVGVRRK